MADKLLFNLNDKYRLAYDAHQWVVQRRDGKTTWRGIAFIGSKKETLWRTFREKQIWLTDEAIEKVDAMPGHFFSFLREHDPELAKRHPIYKAHLAKITPHTTRSRPSGHPDTGQEEVAAVQALNPVGTQTLTGTETPSPQPPRTSVAA